MSSKEFPVFRIATDIDGVLLQSEVPLLQAVFKNSGVKISKPDLVSWNSVNEIVTRQTNNPDLGQRMNDLWFNVDALKNSPAYKGAVITAILCQGIPHCRQYALTSRPPNFRLSTLLNLHRYLPFIDWKSQLLIRNDTSQTGDDFKVGQINHLGIAHMIEDSPTTFPVLLRQTRCDLLYVNQPWNRFDTQHQKYRVDPNNFMTMFASVLRARQRFYRSQK